MAEQLVERLPAVSGRPATAEMNAAVASRNSQDSLRQARVCLEHSSRRLKRVDGEQADEVLALLRKATDHLRQSITAG